MILKIHLLPILWTCRTCHLTCYCEITNKHFQDRLFDEKQEKLPSQSSTIRNDVWPNFHWYSMEGIFNSCLALRTCALEIIYVCKSNYLSFFWILCNHFHTLPKYVAILASANSTLFYSCNVFLNLIVIVLR